MNRNNLFPAKRNFLFSAKNAELINRQAFLDTEMIRLKAFDLIQQGREAIGSGKYVNILTLVIFFVVILSVYGIYQLYLFFIRLQLKSRPTTWIKKPTVTSTPITRSQAVFSSMYPRFNPHVYSFHVWVNMNTDDNISEDRYLFLRGSPGGNHIALLFPANQSDLFLSIDNTIMKNGNRRGEHFQQKISMIEFGYWTLISASIVNNRVEIYINGCLRETIVLTDAMPSTFSDYPKFCAPITFRGEVSNLVYQEDQSITSADAKFIYRIGPY